MRQCLRAGSFSYFTPQGWARNVPSSEGMAGKRSASPRQTTGRDNPTPARCVHVVQLLPEGPPSVKRAHLDRRPTGDGGLTPPRQRLVQINGFQHPKTADVLLGLQVRPIGDEHLAIGLR